MATPDPAVLAELTAQCSSSSRPQGVIFLGQAQLQDGYTPEPPPAALTRALISQPFFFADSHGHHLREPHHQPLLAPSH